MPTAALGWRRRRNAIAKPRCCRTARSVARAAHRAWRARSREDARREEVFALEALLEELNGVGFPEGLLRRPGERQPHEAARDDAEEVLSRRVRAAKPPARGNAGARRRERIGQRCAAAIDGRAIALLRLDRALEAAREGAHLTAGRTAPSASIRRPGCFCLAREAPCTELVFRRRSPVYKAASELGREQFHAARCADGVRFSGGCGSAACASDGGPAPPLMPRAEACEASVAEQSGAGRPLHRADGGQHARCAAYASRIRRSRRKGAKR